MAPTRNSNIERRRERDHCREALSKHIHQTLGLEVRPSEVRLVTRARDAYAWKVLPGREHYLSPVFTKSLSDHSISTYRLLSKEVGSTFEAVGASTTSETSLECISLVSPPKQSFSSIIDQLTEQNHRLSEELHQVSAQTQEESRLRQIVEEENCKLRAAQEELETRVQGYAEAEANLKGILAQVFNTLDGVIPSLESLRKQAQLCSTNTES